MSKAPVTLTISAGRPADQCRAHVRDDRVVGGVMRCQKAAGHGMDLGHRCGDEYWDDISAFYPTPAGLKLPADHDPVNEPEHYKFPGGAEVIHITQHLSFLTGSAVKYAARAGRKPGSDPLEDLRKARRCIDKEIERLEAARGTQ